jgi:predicted flap endonuclease-1-like 5' DNA nuclease
LEGLRTQYAELTARQSELEQRVGEAESRRDAAQTEVLQREIELAEARSKLQSQGDWQERVPAVAALGASLARMSDTKITAANAAADVNVLPQMTGVLQDLADVPGIGEVYEQRLYNAGVGSFWELATLSEEQLRTILELNELQELRMDLAEIQAQARRLAEETGTVGVLWSGEAPDNFEPIDGIGKVYEQRLYDAGIRTYEQIAAATPEQLDAIIQPRKPQNPDYASWIEQARQMAAAKGQE